MPHFFVSFSSGGAYRSGLVKKKEDEAEGEWTVTTPDRVKSIGAAPAAADKLLYSPTRDETVRLNMFHHSMIHGQEPEQNAPGLGNTPSTTPPPARIQEEEESGNGGCSSTNNY